MAKKLSALAAGAVAMSLLLGASAAQAATVVRDPGDPGTAIGIRDLNVSGTLYDVDFVGPTEAVNVYGPLPGTFDFTTSASAQDAVAEVAAALNLADGVLRVGPDGDVAGLTYRVGWETSVGPLDVDLVSVWEGVGESGEWAPVPDPDALIYAADSRMYADFTVVDSTVIPVPAAVWLFGSGLVGLIGIARRTKTA